jgi:hypothetical protein
MGIPREGVGGSRVTSRIMSSRANASATGSAASAATATPTCCSVVHGVLAGGFPVALRGVLDRLAKEVAAEKLPVHPGDLEHALNR